MNAHRTIVVSRHPGAVAFVRDTLGLVDGHYEVREHLDLAEIGRPARLIGVLPMVLVEQAILAGHEVILVVMPRIPADRRGQDLSSDEMRQYGAELRRVVSARTEAL